MYYKKVGVYLKDNVLFDLINLCMYKVNEDALKIFDSLYNNLNNLEIRKLKDYNLIKNTFFSSYRKEKRYEDMDDIINIQIKVSNTCNLKCRYCYAKYGNYGKKDSLMPKDIAYKIANKIKETFPSVQKVSFFGGEPLMNIDAIETIIKTINNKNIKYSMVTNGTIMNDRLMDILKENDIETIISIDGPEEINDLNRTYKTGGGTYKTIASNIKTIQDNMGTVRMLASVYTKPSYLKYSKKEICEFLYNTFHVKTIGISDVFTEIEELKISDDIKNKCEMKAKDLVEYTFDKIMNKQFFLINEVYDVLCAFFNQASMNEFCGAGTMSLFIDEIGNVYPCQLFADDEEFYMGNILKNHGKSYKQSDDYIAIRNKLKSVQKCSISKCECCIAKFWCFRCIGQHKKESNFGACKNENECSRIVDITIETLNKIVEYMNKGKFNKLIENINELTYTM